MEANRKETSKDFLDVSIIATFTTSRHTKSALGAPTWRNLANEVWTHLSFKESLLAKAFLNYLYFILKPFNQSRLNGFNCINYPSGYLNSGVEKSTLLLRIFCVDDSGFFTFLYYSKRSSSNNLCKKYS